MRLRIRGDRATMRRALITTFLDEEPGTGKGELCSKHIYVVERAASGHLIEIHRPGFRNHGMDFTVRCPSIRFNPGNAAIRHMPRHEDLDAAFLSLKRK